MRRSYASYGTSGLEDQPQSERQELLEAVQNTLREHSRDYVNNSRQMSRQKNLNTNLIGSEKRDPHIIVEKFQTKIDGP